MCGATRDVRFGPKGDIALAILMFCRRGRGTYYSTQVDIKKGVEFHMKVKGNNTPGGDGNSWAPGDFGLLDPPGLNSSGANLIRNLLSSQTPQFCYANNLSPRTGQAVQKVSDGLNVRFDMPVNGNQTGLDTKPAPNIIRGLYQQNCGSNPKYCATPFGRGNQCSGINPTVPMPEDLNTQITGNMFRGTGVGAGPTSGPGSGSLNVAAANLYWLTHYGSNWPTELNVAGQANRYRAYLREAGLDVGFSAPTLTQLPPEQTTPLCTTPGSTDPERRIINVAIVNCNGQNVHGNSPIALRPTAYAKMFLFRPSWDYSNMNANSGDVWGELVDVIPIDHTLAPPNGPWTLVLVRDHCDPATMLGCP
jgi:hypothetical protein